MQTHLMPLDDVFEFAGLFLLDVRRQEDNRSRQTVILQVEKGALHFGLCAKTVRHGKHLEPAASYLDQILLYIQEHFYIPVHPGGILQVKSTPGRETEVSLSMKQKNKKKHYIELQSQDHKSTHQPCSLLNL